MPLYDYYVSSLYELFSFLELNLCKSAATLIKFLLPKYVYCDKTDSIFLN